MYKDNVESASDCCKFCHSNIKCALWTLQSNIGRCYLKHKRGNKLKDVRYISGFSDRCKYISVFILINKNNSIYINKNN